VTNATGEPPANRHSIGTDFRSVWLAVVVSSTGDGMFLTAFPLLAVMLTRDPVLIAGVTISTRLPWLLFSLVTGAIADRMDRRKLMIAADLLSANARFTSGQIVSAQFVGPPLGVALFNISTSLPFVVDAVSFAGSAALIATVPDKHGVEKPETRFRDDIIEGLRFTLNNKPRRRQTLASNRRGCGLRSTLFAAADLVAKRLEIRHGHLILRPICRLL